MVHSHQALLLIAPLKHGEIDNPEAGKLILVAQAQLTAHLETELAELLACAHDIVAAEYQYQVARLGLHGGAQLPEDVLSVEFIY